MRDTWPRDHDHGAPSGGPLSLGAAPPPTAHDPDEPYELGGLLGRGGMGEVRVAHDPRLGRDVALKRPRPGDAQAAARLAREAALTASLEHPNIVTVYAAGRDPDGQPYYTMRVLPGRSLAAAISDAGDLPARLRLVRHVLGAADALAYAHGREVLHRDLKPANIMVGAFGETVVADWGLACTLAGQPGAPSGGTPGYMSPEQAAGEPLDARTDVYGLGAVLWEILTGTPPTPGAQLRPVRRTAPEVPAELAAIADRAVRWDREERYPSARALADDLLAWFEGRRVGAYEYTMRELTLRLLTAWRIPLTVGALGLLALAIAVGVGWARTAAESARAQASETAAVEARQAEHAALAGALLMQALTAAGQDRAMEAEVLAVNSLVRRESPEARGVLARFFDRPRMGLVTRSGLLPVCRVRALSPSGDLLLCADVDEVTLRAAMSPGTVLARTPGIYEALVFAAEDGRPLLIGRDEVPQLWAPPAEPSALGAMRMPDPTFGPSAISGRIAAIVKASTVVVDTSQRSLHRINACVPRVDVAVAIAADGSLYVGCDDRRILHGPPEGPMTELVRLADRDVIQSIALPSGGASGEGLYIGTLRGMVLQLDAAGTERARLHAGTEAVRRVAVAEDRLATATAEGAVRVWEKSSGLPLGELHAPGALIAWREGGDQLRILGRTTEDRRVPAPERPHLLPVGAGVAGVAIAPDGASVAVALGDGTTEEIRLHDGRTQQSWRWQGGVAKDVAYRDDGARLATAQAGGQDQRVFNLPEGRLVGSIRGMNLRRVSWTRSGWLLAAAYVPGLYGWRDGDESPTRLLDAQFTELEVDASGERVVAIDVDSGVWRGVDGVRPQFERITTVPLAQSAAPLGEDTLVTFRQTLVRLDARGVETNRWELPSDARDLAVSPDGSRFAIGHATGDTTIWKVGGVAPEARLIGHTARVGALAFTPDGRWLVTGGWDDSVRVWSLGILDIPAETLRQRLETEWGRTLDEVLADQR